MIEINFRSSGGDITGFTCRGHSGYSIHDSDIVCAAVTSAIRLCEATLSDVIGAGCQTEVDEETAFIGLTLPSPARADDCETIQVVLSGLMLYLSQLRDEYPEYIAVFED